MIEAAEDVFLKESLRADLHRARHDGRSEWAVVTFTERCNRDRDGPGFGTQFLLKEGYDVLAVKNTRDDWYANLQLDDLAALTTALEPYRHRACYGSSMGAFAAIKYAKPLGAERAIAISPILDIRYDWDTRFHVDVSTLAAAGYSAVGDMLGPQDIAPLTTYHVALDPYCIEDLRHAEMLSGMTTKTNLLRVPLGGHPVGPSMRDSGALSTFVLDAIERNDTTRVKIKPPERTRHAQHARARYLLGQQKLKSALIVSTSALAQSPDWGEAQLVQAQILDRLDRTDEAIPFGLRAIELEPDNPYFVAIVAEFLIARGRFELAQTLLSAGMKRHGLLKVLLLAEQKIELAKVQ